MDLVQLRKERDNWLKWKNIVPLRESIENLKEFDKYNFVLEPNDWLGFSSDSLLNPHEKELLEKIAKSLIPWRKGPFDIEGLKIDSEWQSNKKYNLLRPHFDLKNKIVADVGCNNGYYMFRMLEDDPKRLVGFDPSPFFKTQFDFINYFAKTDIRYEMLGVEHLEYYEHKFDFIFMLGVLYHRSDPISALKSLNRALNKDGEIIVDSFMMDGVEEVALCPTSRYAKIPNIYFIPTVNCFKNWLSRAGFIDIELIEITQTDGEEQRVTPWTFDQSLDHFLDENDKSKTVEGYPAPKRAYLKARKK